MSPNRRRDILILLGVFSASSILYAGSEFGITVGGYLIPVAFIVAMFVIGYVAGVWFQEKASKAIEALPLDRT